MKTPSKVGELGYCLGNALAFVSSSESLKGVIWAKGTKCVTVGLAAMGAGEGPERQCAKHR